MGTEIHIHSSIVKRAQKGERKAQEELYTLYSKAMFNVSLRILNNKEEAEDVLQESFVSAFQKLSDFRHESGYGSWMKRIVVNRSLNRLKKKRLKFVELNHDRHGDTSAPEEPDDELPELDVTDIKNAVRALPNGYRSIFTLYMFEDWSHKEIANQLDISVSTSKSQLNRAKKKVKKMLLQLQDEKRQA